MISKIPYTCQTFVISKTTLHLSNIRDLKNNPTPVKHSWSQKNTPHLSNIRDLKKKNTPLKHPRSTVKKKNTPHLTNIRNLNLFSREKFTRKNGKKIRESFVKRLVHLSKGWSICQKVRSICQRCARNPLSYTTHVRKHKSFCACYRLINFAFVFSGQATTCSFSHSAVCHSFLRKFDKTVATTNTFRWPLTWKRLGSAGRNVVRKLRVASLEKKWNLWWIFVQLCQVCSCLPLQLLSGLKPKPKPSRKPGQCMNSNAVGDLRSHDSVCNSVAQLPLTLHEAHQQQDNPA